MQESRDEIVRQCDEVKAMLLAKNEAYGDSALNPMRVFSRASTTEQIRVRIDDKLSRLARGSAFGDEDTILDLIGYLILLRIAGKGSKLDPMTRPDSNIRGVPAVRPPTSLPVVRPLAFFVVDFEGLTVVDGSIYSEASPTSRIGEFEKGRFCLYQEMGTEGYAEAYLALDGRIRDEKRFSAFRNLPSLVRQRKNFAASYPHLVRRR